MERAYIEIFERLKNQHGNAECELNFKSNFELLVAVILSAQCTDARVNKVTEKLFQKYNTPEDFDKIDIEELKKLIFTCGFYNSKAKAIKETSRDILEKFNGQVPSTVEELMELRGVGRKTANVVYAVAFGGNAIAVDTHVLRVSYRLGLSEQNKNPLTTEKDLNEKFSEDKWGKLHHLLIHHGRYICKSKKPLCELCKLQDICKFKNGELKYE